LPMTGLINRLFDTFGSLKAILEARPEQLLSVDGMTMSRASMISLVVPLTRVWHRCLMAEPDRIGNSREAEAYCLSLLAGERLENFYVIALNAKCHVLGKRRISMGSLSECSAYPRLVIETALNYNAHSVLLCHSHPGLTCAPSPEDISSTLQLQRLLNGVGILLLDHLIIAGDRSYSMVTHGDIDYRIKRYMNVKSVSDINAIEVFDEVMSLAAKNHVSMPGRFTMLARSLTTLEGVIEQLCPDLNIFDMLYDKLKERARQNMNIPRELFEKGQELVKAGKKAARIPLLASEVLEGMVKGKTKVRFELSGYEEPLNRIFHFLRYTVLTLVALVLFIGSCILCTTDFKPILPNGVPLLAVAGIVFSIALAIFSIKKLK
jgi:DNA repair protein RadC